MACGCLTTPTSLASLVASLRSTDLPGWEPEAAATMRHAADVIERLTGELDELRSAVNERDAEITRLRAGAATAADDLQYVNNGISTGMPAPGERRGDRAHQARPRPPSWGGGHHGGHAVSRPHPSVDCLRGCHFACPGLGVYPDDHPNPELRGQIDTCTCRCHENEQETNK